MELRRIPDRMVITPQDIVNITGKNIRASQRLLRKIRIAQGKPKTGLVSWKEFCTYSSLDIEEVIKFSKF